MTFIEPVFDRTQDDVNEARELFSKGYTNLNREEKEKWDAGLKGTLNMSDLERIENNIQYISDLFDLKLSTNYGKIPALPRPSYYQELLGNTDSIRSKMTIRATTPATPTKVNGFEDINAIEQILFDVVDIYESRWIVYTGDGLHTGEYIGA